MSLSHVVSEVDLNVWVDADWWHLV